MHFKIQEYDWILAQKFKFDDLRDFVKIKFLNKNMTFDTVCSPILSQLFYSWMNMQAKKLLPALKANLYFIFTETISRFKNWEYLSGFDAQCRVQFRSFLLNLRVKVSTDSLRGPRLVIKVRASLLFRISCHIRHHLQISRLRNEPLIDEKLRIFGETQVEFTLSFHRIDRVNRLVDFVIQILNFHLAIRKDQF